MHAPWFGRWAGFGYIAASWQGWLATISCLAAGGVVAGGFHILALWKMAPAQDP
ncbi:hypothetical protein ACQKOH_02840 [Sphingomonas sp. NPDC092331]|jgi:hypothetical protein|uniref:hypothetical protein n=1 Tax=unclassified Sphingomonas TaxID=196159 RepID=UPI0031F5B2DD